VRLVLATVILVAAAVLAAPSAAGRAQNEGARADLRHLAEQMEQIHPNLFHGMTREEWREAVDALDARLPGLGRDQVLVEFMRLVARVSVRGGRDGHMHAWPADETHPGLLPLRIYFFSDGLHVVGALPPYGDLVGSRISAFNGHPLDEVVRAVEPLVGRDNEASVPLFLPLYLLIPNVLSGLGVTPADQPVPITTVDRSGRERTTAVSRVPFARYLDWASNGIFRLPARKSVWLGRQAKPFWWRYLPSSRTLFVQYNAVQGPPSSLVTALRRRAARRGVQRVVIDLRHNSGGDNSSYNTLLAALRRAPFNRPRKLYVLLGRLTFSAAGNFATEVDLQTRAIFAGEPMGGGLNQYGQASIVTLSRLPIPIAVPVATQFYEYAPGDPRSTITPELPAPLSSADYFAGRDPALRAAIAHSRGAR
jgi:hypothetical protein